MKEKIEELRKLRARVDAGPFREDQFGDEWLPSSIDYLAFAANNILKLADAYEAMEQELADLKSHDHVAALRQELDRVNTVFSVQLDAAITDTKAAITGRVAQLEQQNATLKAQVEKLRTAIRPVLAAVDSVPDWDGDDGGVIHEFGLSLRAIHELKSAIAAEEGG